MGFNKQTLSKEVFIAANLKIDDFNDVEYEAIDGGLSVYESAAYEEAWDRTLSKAIDMDEKNDESDYKNLFYISDLYADDLGLAFYNFDGVIRIPEAQPTGIQFLGNDVYVSQSTNHSSSIRTNYKGVDIYTFGLLFHYEDGTVVGDFAETFYYSEDVLEYTKDDFLGSFTLIGGSSSVDVEITESDNSNFAITGITYVEEVIATFDPAEPKMTIAAQQIADIVLGEDTYEATWYTNTLAGASGSATLEFAFNLRGDLVLTDSSVGIGYRILVENVADEDDAGWLTTVNNLVFVVPDAEEEQVLTEATLQKNASATTRSAGSGPNFSVQGKMDVNNASKLVRSQSARRIN